MTEEKKKKVFISYSQDNEAIREKVRALADWLIQHGVDCALDLYQNPPPPEGWVLWMQRQLEEADFVLVICTRGYFEKAGQPGRRSGVKFESILAAQMLYDMGMWNERFLPVLLEGANEDVIPPWLKSYQRYQVDPEQGYEELYRRLTDQPRYIKPEPGPLQILFPLGSSKPASATPIPAEQLVQEFPHVRQLQARVRRFLKPARSDVAFPITISLAESYEDLLAPRFLAAGLGASELLDSDYTCILIHAPGGSGKTKYLGLLVDEAIRRGAVPFYLDLKHGISGASEHLQEGFGLSELFTAFTVAALSEDFSRALLSARPVMLFVDGLNEVPLQSSTLIARVLDDLSRKEPTLRIVVADRMTSQEGLDLFLRARIDPLPEELIRARLAGQALAAADLQILSVPFFLDLRLRLEQSHPGEKSRSGMFESYFFEVAEIPRDLRQKLAQRAFEAYDRFKSRTFERSWWEEALPAGVAEELERAGITISTKPGAGDEKRLIFRHQLLHDYLVGAHLAAGRENDWSGEALDSATFQGNSIEPLSFAGELLGPHADEFLEQVYDWSYGATIDTLADLEHSLPSSPISRDLLFAILALNAEKRFDRFERTATAAEQRIASLLPNPQAQAVLGAPSLVALMALVRAFAPQAPKLVEWRRVFLLEGAVSERDLRTLAAAPVVGWTAANSLRRSALTESQVAQLRAMLFVPGKPSIRWRIVHVLGRFPSAEVVELLLEMALKDDYVWVKYGATRSALEIVSCANSPFRPKALAQLMESLPGMSDVLLRQIRDSVFIRDADRDWYRDAYPLVERASERVAVGPEKERWTAQLSQVANRAGLTSS